MRRLRKAPPANLVRRGPCRRTVFIRNNQHDRAPQELWDLIVNGSDVVLIIEAPDEGFSVYGDRVVAWNAPDVTVDGLIYQWPEQSSEVRRLFEP
jgi:hypothetical protein